MRGGEEEGERGGGERRGREEGERGGGERRGREEGERGGDTHLTNHHSLTSA